MASLLSSMPPSTDCSAATSCGGVRSNSAGATGRGSSTTRSLTRSSRPAAAGAPGAGYCLPAANAHPARRRRGPPARGLWTSAVHRVWAAPRAAVDCPPTAAGDGCRPLRAVTRSATCPQALCTCLWTKNSGRGPTRSSSARSAPDPPRTSPVSSRRRHTPVHSRALPRSHEERPRVAAGRRTSGGTQRDAAAPAHAVPGQPRLRRATATQCVRRCAGVARSPEAARVALGARAAPAPAPTRCAGLSLCAQLLQQGQHGRAAGHRTPAAPRCGPASWAGRQPAAQQRLHGVLRPPARPRAWTTADGRSTEHRGSPGGRPGRWTATREPRRPLDGGRGGRHGHRGGRAAGRTAPTSDSPGAERRGAPATAPRTRRRPGPRGPGRSGRMQEAGDDVHLHRGLDLGVHLDGDRVRAEGLDRRVHGDEAAVELRPAGSGRRPRRCRPW